MICFTNADYYAPEPPTLRTEELIPFTDGEITSLREAFERGYERFCRVHFIKPHPLKSFFGRKPKQNP